VRRSLVRLGLALALLACARASAEGWETIAPGGATGCGPGGPYAFFVHRGDPERLLVVFQGGGACWSYPTCSLDGPPTYDPLVEPADLAGSLQGVLDRAHPENPFAAWTMLFVAYCTGDVHLGARTQRYPFLDEDGGVREVTVQHRGQANAMAALGWAFAELPAVRQAMVLGESAGGVASPHYAAVVAERYPRARVAQLADGSGGLVSGALGDLVETWGAGEALRAHPAYRARGAIDFTDLYAVAAIRAPRVSFAQLDHDGDPVQSFFVGLAGRGGVAQRALLDEGRRLVRAEVPGLRSYTAQGQAHTTLSTPAFYTARTRGTRLRDWVAALADGAPASDVAP
jgi:hypothetical protein